MLTRLISFAGSTIAIEYEGPQPAHIVNFLTQNIARNIAPPTDVAASHVTFRLGVDENPQQLCLSQPDKPDYKSDSGARIAQTLLGNSGFHLADRSQGGLLFHAGGLERQGAGVLLPGTMGAGKTTLTAWLLTKGFNYLTDELVFIAHNSLTMQGFGRPLNIKSPARPVLQAFVDFQQDSRIFSTPTTNLVPPDLFNPTTTFSQPPLRLIIFPNYQTDSEFQCQHLSPAQAGFALMQCLINARNLPEHGFPEISRLAQAVPAYKMTYASFEQVGNKVETLLKFVNSV